MIVSTLQHLPRPSDGTSLPIGTDKVRDVAEHPFSVQKDIVVLPPESLALIELMAFSYLQCRRPGHAAKLFALLACDAQCDDRLLGAFALAQLRSGFAEAALGTLARASLASQLAPPFQLLRAQALQNLQRRDEATVAMRAFVSSRLAKLATAHARVKPADGSVASSTAPAPAFERPIPATDTAL